MGVVHAQQDHDPLSTRYEELTAPEFRTAVERAQRTVVIPLGIMEKHGPHLPLGTDLINIREVVLRAAEKEYVVVYPPYYVGQIFEARHQPGTIAYSSQLMWDMLQETCDELSRNGFTKIVLINGHGGNTSFLQYFCQAQLARRRPYAVYLDFPWASTDATEKIAELQKTPMDMHAGETETAAMLAHRPDLVKLEAAGQQSGEDQQRLAHLHGLYTGIWWYARFPNHYGGDATPATPELGAVILDAQVEHLAALFQTVKADTTTLELQERFFDEAEAPLKTKQ